MRSRWFATVLAVTFVTLALAPGPRRSGTASAEDPLDRKNGVVPDPRAHTPAQGPDNPAAHPEAIFKAPEQVLKDEDSRRQPGTVSGNVYGVDGKPFKMKGAKVEVRVWGLTGKEDIIGVRRGDPGGERTSYTIPVDADGHYLMKVANGVYKVICQAMIPFEDEMVPVGLDALDDQAPDEYDQSSGKGIVKDFGLKFTGPRAGGAKLHGYNGVSLRAYDQSDILNRMHKRYPKGTELHVLLTPTSPLLDGSAGWPIDCHWDVSKFAIANAKEGVFWGGIPYAAYRATAKVVTPDGRETRCRVGTSPGGRDLHDACDVTFTVEHDRFIGPSVRMPCVYATDQAE